MKKPDYERDRVLRHRREHLNDWRRHKPEREGRRKIVVQEKNVVTGGLAADGVRAVGGLLSQFFRGKKLESLKGHQKKPSGGRGH